MLRERTFNPEVMASIRNQEPREEVGD